MPITPPIFARASGADGALIFIPFVASNLEAALELDDIIGFFFFGPVDSSSLLILVAIAEA